MILCPAQVKPPSPFKAASRPYRLPTLSPEQVYTQEKKAVESFTLPIAYPAPSNLLGLLSELLLSLVLANY
jgi:hypothetical protein